MYSSAILTAVLLPLCSGQLNQYAQKAGLKYFGTATDSPGQRERAGYEADYPQYDAVLADNAEFGLTTPTNGQKWLFIEPEQGVFNFTEGDIVANIAKEDGLTLRCHTLVWHSQLPDWVTSQNWTAEALTDVVVNHITNVMNHYKGQCYAWDVVNEALNDDGTYRSSPFYDTLGEDFIKLAFRTAAEVEPDVKLYYNDYNIESPGNKSQSAANIVKMLQADGIKIDGVGMQGHFVASSPPSLEEQKSVIKLYGDLGVEVAYTELDVRIDLPLNDTNLAWQADGYANTVRACLQSPACIGLEIWDFYDPFSWIPAVFPTQGNALLWFEDFSKHPAYNAIIDALKNGTGSYKTKGGPSIRKASRSTGLY